MSEIHLMRVSGEVGDFERRSIHDLMYSTGYQGDVNFNGTAIRIWRGPNATIGPLIRLNIPRDWFSSVLGKGQDTLIVERDAGVLKMVLSGLSRRDGTWDFTVKKFELRYQESWIGEKCNNLVFEFDIHIGQAVGCHQGLPVKPADRYWASSVVIMDDIYDFLTTRPNDLDLEHLQDRMLKEFAFDLDLSQFDPRTRTRAP